MKTDNYTKWLLAVLLMVVMISASTVQSLITVQPKVPKVQAAFRAESGEALIRKIRDYQSQGFIVTHIATTSNGIYLGVLVKY